MTVEGWREIIIDAVRKADAGDAESLDLLAKTLEELDQAKQRLHDAGYGCTGMGILQVAYEIVQAKQPQRRWEQLFGYGRPRDTRIDL